jgi:hypothetical protein
MSKHQTFRIDLTESQINTNALANTRFAHVYTHVYQCEKSTVVE